ncbi:MAG TPA: dihydropteroate synthase [Microthrixaceae bacterium]|nr:dihydropteroate synthase [Microthrixaceae bacterium]
MIPQIMGILNVTPDSFSDGGRYSSIDAAVDRARTLIAEGATIVDVGGESTRPGAEPVPIDEELRRVVPVVEAIAPLGVRISVDTRHAEVARAAVTAGATMINDVGASLWEVAADLGVAWLAMHMQGEPGTMQDDPRYVDVRTEVYDFLAARAASASAAGVAEVWVDAGFGFGKTLDHNLELVADIDQLVQAGDLGGFRVALGVSRKKSLGLMTARADGDSDGVVAPPSERLEVGVALATWAMLSGVQMIRAHDVRPHAEAARAVVAYRSNTAPVPAPAGR